MKKKMFVIYIFIMFFYLQNISKAVIFDSSKVTSKLRIEIVRPLRVDSLHDIDFGRVDVNLKNKVSSYMRFRILGGPYSEVKISFDSDVFELKEKNGTGVIRGTLEIVPGANIIPGSGPMEGALYIEIKASLIGLSPQLNEGKYEGDCTINVSYN